MERRDGGEEEMKGREREKEEEKVRGREHTKCRFLFQPLATHTLDPTSYSVGKISLVDIMSSTQLDVKLVSPMFSRVSSLRAAPCTVAQLCGHSQGNPKSQKTENPREMGVEGCAYAYAGV